MVLFKKYTPSLKLLIRSVSLIMFSPDGIEIVKTFFFLFCIAIKWREIECDISGHDLRRLEKYSKNLVDWHLVTDLVPAVALLFCRQTLPDLTLSNLQAVSTIYKLLCLLKLQIMLDVILSLASLHETTTLYNLN